MPLLLLLLRLGTGLAMDSLLSSCVDGERGANPVLLLNVSRDAVGGGEDSGANSGAFTRFPVATRP